MRFLNYLKSFSNSLRRRPQPQRPKMRQTRPQLEELGSRIVLSTLNIDAAGHALYTAGAGVNNNLTLSVIPGSGKIAEQRIFTDTAETIQVTGPGAVFCKGSGTHQVICSGASSITSISVSLSSGKDTATVQSIDVPTTLNTGSGSTNTFVQATSAPLTIQGHGGTDTVNIANLAGIQGSVSIGNTAATTTAIVSSTKTNTATLSDTALTGLSPAPILFQKGALKELFLNPNAGTLTVTNTPGLTVLQVATVGLQLNVQGLTGELDVSNTGTANGDAPIQGGSGTTAQVSGTSRDTIIVGTNAPGTGGTLANINGVLDTTRMANTTVILDDSGDATARNVNVSIPLVGHPNVTGLAPAATIRFCAGNNDSLTINGGKGGNTFNQDNPHGASTVIINGGAGANTLASVSGANTFKITAANAGTLDNITFQNVQNLQGGASSTQDTFLFSNGASVSGAIRGGGGNNAKYIATLDYSNLFTPVTVNLKTHAATGAGGGVFNIRNVTGGLAGNDIIVGDGNNNTLIGGGGRSILISGGGQSTLKAGFGEAILIGGQYEFDTDQNALDHLMAEWSRTDLKSATDPTGYLARVQHLENGGGLNGAFVLNKTSVVADAGTQTLTTGFGLDFLIVDATDLLINALRKGEQKLVV